MLHAETGRLRNEDIRAEPQVKSILQIHILTYVVVLTLFRRIEVIHDKIYLTATILRPIGDQNGVQTWCWWGIMRRFASYKKTKCWGSWKMPSVTGCVLKHADASKCSPRPPSWMWRWGIGKWGTDGAREIKRTEMNGREREGKLGLRHWL